MENAAENLSLLLHRITCRIPNVEHLNQGWQEISESINLIKKENIKSDKLDFNEVLFNIEVKIREVMDS
ncbi:hypothetical protein [Mucilaginibacter sp. R-33]|uniref:hypothetical protein n=1 Tax=Mucilaginibacter sp. R-33 TaxID=3416711 RepID=UPI003CF4AA8A